MCKLHYSNPTVTDPIIEMEQHITWGRVVEGVTSEHHDFSTWLLFSSDLLISVVNGVYALAAMAFILHLPAAS